jgi:hypothetical protein
MTILEISNAAASGIINQSHARSNLKGPVPPGSQAIPGRNNCRIAFLRADKGSKDKALENMPAAQPASLTTTLIKLDNHLPDMPTPNPNRANLIKRPPHFKTLEGAGIKPSLETGPAGRDRADEAGAGL